MISRKDSGLVSVGWFWVVVGSDMGKEYHTMKTIKFRWNLTCSEETLLQHTKTVDSVFRAL